MKQMHFGLFDSFPFIILVVTSCITLHKRYTILILKFAATTSQLQYVDTFKHQPHKMVKHSHKIRWQQQFVDQFVGLAFKGLIAKKIVRVDCSESMLLLFRNWSIDLWNKYISFWWGYCSLRGKDTRMTFGMLKDAFHVYRKLTCFPNCPIHLIHQHNNQILKFCDHHPASYKIII